MSGTEQDDERFVDLVGLASSGAFSRIPFCPSVGQHWSPVRSGSPSTARGSCRLLVPHEAALLVCSRVPRCLHLLCDRALFKRTIATDSETHDV